MNITAPLFVLVGGLAFAGGFLVGSAVFACILRQRERRVAIKIKAIEAVRQYLYRHGIELSAWVTSVIDSERQEHAARQPRRWWQRGRWSK
jgi:hypothetical protein